MNRVCVRLDVDRLRERLSREQGRALTAMEVHRWLNKVGFVLEGWWQCDGPQAVDHLRPDEIIDVIRTEGENGITFVYRGRPG